VLAFVDHDKAISGGQVGQIVAPGEALNHTDVDDPVRPLPPRSELSNLLPIDPEVLDETLAPLLYERLPIHDDQRRYLVPRDRAACDHRLACAGRCDKDAKLVRMRASTASCWRSVSCVGSLNSIGAGSPHPWETTSRLPASTTIRSA
jgi:hypothetical protein